MTTTRQENQTKTHFMGTAGTQNTACNRYVALTGSSVRWSSDPAEVTCNACAAAVTA